METENRNTLGLDLIQNQNRRGDTFREIDSKREFFADVDMLGNVMRIVEGDVIWAIDSRTYIPEKKISSCRMVLTETVRDWRDWFELTVSSYTISSRGFDYEPVDFNEAE